ncbi:zinc-binding alcohol dehydrogenase [Amycolatopsis carbonis]|uniref:Zinc-binding alcohol dehydrogenase n=1 Tax=Amycolatopsis carbonis TaxID=715471 RepID=A0A9Y2I9P7_9PSEU|nr:zinc-binding alcohol dehydrogenase [Amycolatopsis sp. 2-15]WIX75589.1 zinc-binding alcohol dehydrogenase [Amycolatopsis sp. 2-15]
MGTVVQFVGPRRVEVVETQREELGPGSVRVRTLYSGISAGTELTAYRGTNPYLTRVWDDQRRLFVEGDVSQTYPVVGWGYSEVGEVVEVSPDVAGTQGVPAVGEVVWGIWGHRSEAVVPAAKLADHVVPAGLDPLAASFARVGAVALNGVLGADVHLGETVAVFGQGVIGLLATRMATLNGGRVIACDAIGSRLAIAQEFGAVETVDVTTASAAERVRATTGGHGADVAIELSGTYRALHEAVRAVGVGGRVVAAGFYQGDGTALRLGEEFHHNRVEIVASQIGGVPWRLAGRWDQDRMNRTFLRLAADGVVDPVRLVTHRVRVGEVERAYELLDERPAEALQVVLDYTEN